MLKKANIDIRSEARAARVPLWAVAAKMGIAELTLIRKLRFELPEAEKQEIRELIQQLKNEA